MGRVAVNPTPNDEEAFHRTCAGAQEIGRHRTAALLDAERAVCMQQGRVSAAPVPFQQSADVVLQFEEQPSVPYSALPERHSKRDTVAYLNWLPQG